MYHFWRFSQRTRKARKDISKVMPSEGNINTSFKHKISSKPNSREGQRKDMVCFSIRKKPSSLSSLRSHAIPEFWYHNYLNHHSEKRIRITNKLSSSVFQITKWPCINNTHQPDAAKVSKEISLS